MQEGLKNKQPSDNEKKNDRAEPAFLKITIILLSTHRVSTFEILKSCGRFVVVEVLIVGDVVLLVADVVVAFTNLVFSQIMANSLQYGIPIIESLSFVIFTLWLLELYRRHSLVECLN